MMLTVANGKRFTNPFAENIWDLYLLKFTIQGFEGGGMFQQKNKIKIEHMAEANLKQIKDTGWNPAALLLLS